MNKALLVAAAATAMACAARTAAFAAEPPSPRPAPAVSEAAAAPVLGAPSAPSDDVEKRPLGTVKTSAAGGLAVPSADLKSTAQLLGSLVAVIVLVVAGVWAFRRFAPRSAGMFASEHLRVLARTHIGPRQAMYLVRVPGRLLVVGATQDHIAVLSEIADSVEVEKVLGAVAASSSKSATAAFKELLSGVTRAEKRDARIESELASTVEQISQRLAGLSKKLERSGKQN